LLKVHLRHPWCPAKVASTSDEIKDAFATMVRERAGALIVTGDPIFLLQRAQIVELATSHKLPAIYQWGVFATIGGLMSYGPDQSDLFRRAATFVDKTSNPIRRQRHGIRRRLLE
jgi:putative ABC transport system substrate-binding protein